MSPTKKTTKHPKPKPAKSFVDDSRARFVRDPVTHRLRFIPPSKDKSTK